MEGWLPCAQCPGHQPYRCRVLQSALHHRCIGLLHVLRKKASNLQDPSLLVHLVVVPAASPWPASKTAVAAAAVVAAGAVAARLVLWNDDEVAPASTGRPGHGMTS